MFFLGMQPVIRVTDLWKYYGDDEQGEPALRGTNLEVAAGDIVALFGKSGSGKTTLLNLLAGLDRPTRGRIEIEGQDLEALGERGRTEFRRSRLGFVFQFFNLLPTLTAFENVFLSLELAGRPDPAAARTALASVGLAGKEDRYPHELSGGEQQRVAIARAISKNPAVLLCDEPTGALDSKTGIVVLEALEQINRQLGTATAIITHNVDISGMADRVVHLSNGRITEVTANRVKKSANALQW